MEQNSCGKLPLVMIKTRRDEGIENDVKLPGGGLNWKEKFIDREG